MPYADLADFLVNAQLYRVEDFSEPLAKEHAVNKTVLIGVPQLVDRTCDTCGPTKWSLNRYNNVVEEDHFSELQYQCRNCENAEFVVWMFWRRSSATTIAVEKAGQYPKLEITIPKDFGEALGDKRTPYIKGMTLRHHSYGIGALTYFRRLIEDTTDEMLDLLKESMEEINAEPGAIERLKEAKRGTRFEDKVRIAGEVIPPHLRPGGINPFGDLYELLSIGLHDLSDDECCDIVDAMDQSLKFVYTRLKTHLQEAKAYEQAAKRLNEKVAGFKSRARK
jgi:hypothetical protein